MTSRKLLEILNGKHMISYNFPFLLFSAIFCWGKEQKLADSIRDKMEKITEMGHYLIDKQLDCIIEDITKTLKSI